MSTDLLRECGQRLRESRVAAGLSQVELGGRIGRSQPSIYKWEAGHTEPDLASRRRLADVLGSDPYAIDITTDAGAA